VKGSTDRKRKEAMTENLKAAPGGGWIDALEIGALGPADAGAALDLLSRGMRDNPLHVAVFGEEVELRRRRIRRVFAGAFDAMGWQANMLAARDAEGTIVGLCGALPPGRCQMDLGQQLRVMPRMFANGPRVTARAVRWLGIWGKRDPEERHWHLGPVAVDAHLHGRGVGSKLMEVFRAQMDAVGEAAYLETDKPENVRFYERFGFEVVGEEEVLGVPNWFMIRPARAKGTPG
jgi:ribosomal protein S18 acetylase RimI-like enzyme